MQNTQFFLPNKRNALAGAVASFVAGSTLGSRVVRPLKRQKDGTGFIELGGTYTGVADATFDYEIDTAPITDAGFTTLPIFRGEGSGKMTAVAVDGAGQPEGFTVSVSLTEPAYPEIKATTPVFGAALVNSDTLTPEQGNEIEIEVKRFAEDGGGLSRTALPIATLEAYDKGTADLGGLEAAFTDVYLDESGNLPFNEDDHTRVTFDNHPFIYRAYNEVTAEGIRAKITPALQLPVPAGTQVYTVTGKYRVFIKSPSETETYNATSVYDLLTQIRQRSNLVKVDGAVSRALIPGGQATQEINIYTENYIASQEQSGSFFIEDAELTFNSVAGGPTQQIRITCIDNDTVGAELWRVESDISDLTAKLQGLTLGTATTGVGYAHPTGDFSFTIPQIFSELTVAEPRLDYRVETVAREGSATAPPICVDVFFLSDTVESQTVTFTYTKRGFSQACEEIIPANQLDPSCFPDGGPGPGFVDLPTRVGALANWFLSNFNEPSAATRDIAYSMEEGLSAVTWVVWVNPDSGPNTLEGPSALTDQEFQSYVRDALRYDHILADGAPFENTDVLAGTSKPLFLLDFYIGAKTDAQLKTEATGRDLRYKYYYYIRTTQGFDIANARWYYTQRSEQWPGRRGFQSLTALETARLAEDYQTAVVSGTGLGFYHFGNGSTEFKRIVGRYSFLPFSFDGTTGFGQGFTNVWARDELNPVSQSTRYFMGVGEFFDLGQRVLSFPEQKEKFEAFEDRTISTMLSAFFAGPDGDERRYAESGSFLKTSVGGTLDPVAYDPQVGQSFPDRLFRAGSQDPTELNQSIADEWVILDNELRPLEAQAAAGGAPVTVVPGNCWVDIGETDWWVAERSNTLPALLPAFTNEVYVSAIEEDDGSYPSTGEFGIAIKCPSPDGLVEGDRVILNIIGSGRAKTYTPGDSVVIDIVSSLGTRLRGGESGNDISTWEVTTSVGQRLPNFEQDTTKGAASYSEEGVAFTVSEGTIPFAEGDLFTFTLEKRRFRYRFNTDAFTAKAPLTMGQESVGNGLSMILEAAQSPSFGSREVYRYAIEQKNAVDHLTTSLPNLFQWDGDGCTVDFTFSAQNVEFLAIGYLDLPAGATVTIEGSTDGFSSTEFSEALPVDQLATYVRLSQVYAGITDVRLIVANAEGGSLGWLFAGEAWQPEVTFDVSLRSRASMSSGITESIARRYEGKALNASLSIDEFFERADAEELQDIFEQSKAESNAPILFIPNVGNGLCLLSSFAGDDLEINDLYWFQTLDQSQKVGFSFELQGVIN